MSTGFGGPKQALSHEPTDAVACEKAPEAHFIHLLERAIVMMWFAIHESGFSNVMVRAQNCQCGKQRKNKRQ